MVFEHSQRKATVLITAVDSGSVGGQIAKALKLHSGSYRIIGTNVNRLNLGIRYVDELFALPMASEDSYIQSLLDCCQMNMVDLVFPGSEPELRKIANHIDSFESLGIKVAAASSSIVESCLDKFEVTRLLQRYGMRQPQTLEINAVSDIEGTTFFPVVLKPIRGSGSMGVTIAQNFEELSALVPIWLQNFGPLIAQEYVSSIGGEYTVGVLTDPVTGEIKNSIALRRILDRGIGKGLVIKNRNTSKIADSHFYISTGISQGEIGLFKEVTNQIERLILAMGVRGVVNVQCRLDNNEVVIFEINPRFSGTTYGRALCGYNEPHLVAQRLVFGTQIMENFVYSEGTLLREIKDYLFDKNMNVLAQ